MVTQATGMNEELENTMKDYSAIQSAIEQLHWDQETMMPKAGLPIRKAQLSYLTEEAQDILTSDRLEHALSSYEDSDDETHHAVVRELRRIQDRAKQVPTALTKKVSDAETESVEVWRRARDEDDFSIFKDRMEEMVSLKQDVAEAIDDSREPYEVLFEAYEPHIDMSTVERIFDHLTKELPRRLERVKESDTTTPSPFKGSFDAETQEQVAKGVMADLGLSPDNSRLNLSTHPFTVGSPFETRITTRINESDMTEVLSSTIHECGHGLYAVGLDEENWWNPLGWDRDLTVHESQSRFWENQVGHRESFFEYLLPVLNRHFRGEFDDVTPREAYEAVNTVKEQNMIRTEADQLTYHLHVAIRFEIGKALIRGEIDVKDVQSVWQEKMESYLGLTPEKPSEGVLQDIHWAQGMFGYFPTYTLGSMLAAQLNEAIEEDIDVDEHIRSEDFETILDWQREKVHRHGQRLRTPELIRSATGQELRVDAYLDHIDSLLDDVYGIRM